MIYPNVICPDYSSWKTENYGLCFYLAYFSHLQNQKANMNKAMLIISWYVVFWLAVTILSQIMFLILQESICSFLLLFAVVPILPQVF
jgi:hypothetical protein